MLANLLLDALLLLIPLYYFKSNGINAVESLGIGWKQACTAWKQSIPIIASMLVVALLVGLALNIAGGNDIGKVSDVLQQAKESQIYFIFALTAGVILEELFFRGFLIKFIDSALWQKAKKAKGGLALFFRNYSGVILSSVFFGALHFGYSSTAEIAGAMCLGLVLAFFFKKYNNLYANISAHLIWNALILFAAVAV